MSSRNHKKGIATAKDTMWLYGKHAVKAAISNKHRNILKVVILESNKNFLQEVFDEHETAQRKINTEIVENDYFSRLFGRDATHQGIAALVTKLDEYVLEDFLKNHSDNRPFVFLDQVVDPQNIGSILRASAVFGARAVVVTDDHSPEITPSIAKAASGSLEIVPIIRVTNLVQSVNLLKKHGFWVIGLDERSEKNLSDIDLNEKYVFIIGNEGYGMRRLSKEACDLAVRLPELNVFTTLNAAQAATVALYESCKQRMEKKQ